MEWPTLLLLAATYALWALGTTYAFTLHPAAGILLTGIAIGQFSSLQHEILHGHPFRSRRINEALAFPALTLTVPYGRFRDTHLAHHHDPVLTDPYDDPESNYLDPVVWAHVPGWIKPFYRFNNTLFGRITLGPVLGNILWLVSEWKLLRQDAPGVRRDWALHAAGLVPVILWLSAAAMPWWGYLLAAWIGHGLLKIRTYLEHRAHEAARARTVIIEDRGPLALLFLNNNLHVVHHMHPAVPWYRLPALYAANRDHYIRRNDGYIYRNYLDIFRAHLFRAKDPVPHPLMPGPAEAAGSRETPAETPRLTA
ncbi:MAG: fatty acid desaturase [Rhodobacter sp. CACIA14H1]|nr:MAG: fatty acid desaturase [Rhodobacter sp. CACIA14H1]